MFTTGFTFSPAAKRQAAFDDKDFNQINEGAKEIAKNKKFETRDLLKQVTSDCKLSQAIL